MNAGMDIPIPQNVPQQNPQQHQHNHQCKHHRHQQSQNPFANVPKEMRMFIWFMIVGGDYIFNIFMQLPMMGQLYYFIQMTEATILTPLYTLNGYLNQILPEGILKKLFGGLAIYYFIVHGLLFYYNYVTYPEYQLLLNIIYIILILYIIIIVCPPGYFTQKDFEQLIQQNPEIIQLSRSNRNVCVICQIPKVVRSQHCLYCKKCVKRWEAHSMSFNTCIGVYNLPFYFLYLLTFTIYIFLVLRQYTLIQRSQQKSIFDLFVIIINLQQFYFFGQQFLLSFLRISFNITPTELSEWRRYSYLWADERGKFGNPFNKGFFNNWIQLFKPFFSKGQNNWGTNKYINIWDIPNHPLGPLAQQQIEQQINMMRHHQRQQMRQEPIDEETGLLEP